MVLGTDSLKVSVSGLSFNNTPSLQNGQKLLMDMWSPSAPHTASLKSGCHTASKQHLQRPWLALQKASTESKSMWAFLPCPVMRAKQSLYDCGMDRVCHLLGGNSFLTRSETQQFPLTVTGNKHTIYLNANLSLPWVLLIHISGTE